MIRDYSIREEMGSRIKQLREQKGMSVEELAESIDCNPNTIKRIEEGKFAYNIDILASMANALGVKVRME